MAAKLVTIYWRDIPAQVNAQSGRTRARAALDPRFERAIDRAAMVAGLTVAQDYTAQWRRTTDACGEDLEAAAAERAAQLDAEFDADRLNTLVNHGGFEAGNA